MSAGAVSAVGLRREDRLQTEQKGLLQTVPDDDAQHRERRRRGRRHDSSTPRPSGTLHQTHPRGDPRFRWLQVPSGRTVRERDGMAPSCSLPRRDEMRQVQVQGENHYRKGRFTGGFERYWVISLLRLIAIGFCGFKTNRLLQLIKDTDGNIGGEKC